MFKQQGFVLMPLLIFMSIIFSIIFIEEEHVILEKHRVQNHYDAVQHELLINSVFKKINSHLIQFKKLDCLVHHHSSYWYLEKDNEWWRSKQTCKVQLSQRQFQYIEVELSQQPCIQLNQQPVHFVNLILHSAKTQGALYSEIIALPQNKNVNCEKRIIRLHHIFQGWSVLKN